MDPGAVAALAERMLGAGPASDRKCEHSLQSLRIAGGGPAPSEEAPTLRKREGFRDRGFRGVTVVIQREIAFFEPNSAIRARRNAWKAAVLRGAYRTDWLSPGTVRNIRHVQAAPDGSRVDIWLWGGTWLTDTPDQITVTGPVDAIAVQELVAAIQRRGWTAVAVTGTDEFKRAVADGLALARPPIEVVNHILAKDDVEPGKPSQTSVNTGHTVTRHI